MKFIALPVSQGDAFYAETDDGLRVLVDGGRSRSALPNLFWQHTGSNRVDVLVCTHNDADHAEGVIGFLTSGLHCQELWLPATWLDAIGRLPTVAGETLDFLYERLMPRTLPEEVQDRTQDMAWQAVFPEFHERPAQEPGQEPLIHQETQETVSAIDVFSDVEAIEDHLNLLFPPWDGPFWYRFWYRCTGHRLISTVLGDTRRLLELARLAVHAGIPIRCFRYDPQQASPTVPCLNRLYVLSGRQVRWIPPPAPRRKADEFLQMAFLSTVNRQSLVCYLEGGRDGPGVLFTADSDLDNIDLSHIRKWDIATAPHHGSADNRHAYERIGQPMMWVRSDGWSKLRPCQEYLSAPGKRFCTMCRNSGKPKQAVRFCLRGGRWVRLQTRCCECR